MSRDPRILWLSPDLLWAVIRCTDAPVNAWVGYGFGSQSRAERVDPTGCPVIAPQDPTNYSQRCVSTPSGETWHWYHVKSPSANCYSKISTRWLTGWDLGVVNATVSLNYGTSGPPVQRKAMKEWPHDCPKCKGRECALQLATTWDCRNGCFK